MRNTYIFSSTCIAVVVMLLLSLSVHPAMAAEAVNAELGSCAACGTGMGSISSIPGFEGKKVPTVTIREIPAQGNTVSTSGTRSAAVPATVSGTQKRHVNNVLTLDIRDPLSTGPASAAVLGTDSVSAGEDPAVASVMANLSRAGYDPAGESTHRYESTVTSDDLLVLNSSQKAALGAGGFTLVSSDTVRSNRDVTIYTFTNRTTQSRMYLAAVQQLDTQGNPVGERVLALSPAFTPSGFRVSAATTGTSPAGTSCAAEWIAFILAFIGLVVNIILIITTGNAVFAPVLLDAIATIISIITGEFQTGGPVGTDGGRAMGDRIWAARPYIIGVAVVTGIVLLLLFLYSGYKLGVCMGWWHSWDEIGWSYQYRFSETANGNTVPLSLHDRFALALFADTVTDSDAHWIVATHPGLAIKEELKAKTDNGTLQSWFVEATEAGPHEFSLKYITSKPTPNVPHPEYILHLSVESGSWKITSVDDTGTGSAAGAFPSLRIDPSGTPRMSYSSARLEKIMYAGLSGNSWAIEPVADSAGTYSTSLAFASSGMPAISFGDGLHFGNLMYAERDGTSWNVSVVNKGQLTGDAGEYSSLAFDPYGNPYITFNDGQYVPGLHYAGRNSSRWYNTSIHQNGLSAVTGISSSLAIDKSGTLHVAYNDRRYFGNLRYAVKTASSAWNFTRIDDGGGSTASTGYDPSLALDSHGYPHISYYNSSGTSLRYASWDGSSWNLETIDTGNDVGRYSSLAIDAHDIPHISYYDASYKELRYATYVPALRQWVIRTVDNDGDVGQHSSIALDSSGHPSIAYYDATNHALKYAGWTD